MSQYLSDKFPTYRRDTINVAYLKFIVAFKLLSLKYSPMGQ